MTNISAAVNKRPSNISENPSFFVEFVSCYLDINTNSNFNQKKDQNYDATKDKEKEIGMLSGVVIVVVFRTCKQNINLISGNP